MSILVGGCAHSWVNATHHGIYTRFHGRVAHIGEWKCFHERVFMRDSLRRGILPDACKIGLR